MSSTNHTANYNLPQFLGSDKPAWLGDINPAMTTIDNQMKANADGVAGILDMFNLDHFSSVNASSLITIAGISTEGALRLAQNADGSIFKFYNYIYIQNNTDGNLTIPLTAVPGLSGHYGLKVLQLNQAPTQAYAINAGGMYVFKEEDGTKLQNVNSANFYVGTDGGIYILTAIQNIYGIHQHQEIELHFFPCVYFNGSFGDN